MIGKEKIKDITISEKKGKYNEKKSNKRSVGSFDSLEFCSCGWISWSLRDFMRKLAILVDAAGLVVSSLLPLKPVLVGLYPIFFCSAFQWGVYSSANGYNSATIFSSNNFKQAMLGWTQYFLTKDPEFKKKGILYTNTVLSFFIGACYGAIAVNAFAVRAAYLGSVPLATGWILVVKHSMVLESERPQEIAKEAETELEDAELLETEQK